MLLLLTSINYLNTLLIDLYKYIVVTFRQYYNEGFKEKLSVLGLLASLAFSTPLLSKSADPLFAQLSKHEGFKNNVYKDENGIPTIGIGFNLQDPTNRRILAKYGITDQMLRSGLSDNQVKTLFEESLKRAKQDALKFVPDLYKHPIKVQNAIIDMAFNLGYTRLSKFKDFKESLRVRNYKKAASDMLNSVWARQVKNRATFLAELVRSS